MEHKNAARWLIAFFEGIIQLLFFLLLSGLSAKMWRYVGKPPGNVLWFAHLCDAVIHLLVLYGICRTLAAPSLYTEADIAAAKGGLRDYAAHFLRLRIFWLQIAPKLFLAVLLHPRAGFLPLWRVWARLLGTGVGARWSCSLLLLAPVVLLDLLAKRSAFLQPPPKGRGAGRKRLALQLLFTFLAACVTLPIIGLILITLLSFILENLLRALLLIPLILLIVSSVMALRYLRAMHIRRKFYRALSDLCRERGATLSPLHRPYRSLFYLGESHTFSLFYHGKRYDCQMVSSLRRGNPMYISETGDLEIRHILYGPNLPVHHGILGDRVIFFEYTTRQHYAFEGEGGKKILIVSPVPAEIYAGNTVKHRLADVAERIGDYTVYNGTGFLNAIERDCL